MKISSFFTIITASLLLSLTSEAQYQKMIRSDRSAFDTSVNIEITSYRKIVMKLKSADLLITGLTKERDLLQTKCVKLDSLQQNAMARLLVKDDQLDSKTTALTKMTSAFNDLEAKYVKKFSWLARNKLWIGIGTGFVGGILVYRFVFVQPK